MSIPISSNFNLSAQLPLDARTVVADTIARDLIPSIQRYEGMIVYLVDTEINYQLQGGITNGDWQAFGEARFGIEDNTSSVSRNVDMGGNELVIDNALKVEIVADNTTITSESLYLTVNLTDGILVDVDNTRLYSATSPYSLFGRFPKASSSLNGTKYLPLSVQVNGTETFADTAGKIDLGTITSPTITTSNGLNRVGDDIRLGGTLTSSSTIINTNSRQVVLTNSGSTGQPLSVIGTSGGAASFSATTGSGINVYSTGATAINGTSEGNNFAANFRSWSTSNSSPVNVLKLEALSTTPTVSNGFGSRLEFQNQTNSPNIQISNVFNSVWSNATNATRTSEFNITGVSNALTNTLLTLGGGGSAKLNKYGLGTFTGFPTYNLATDSSGNIIEVAAGGGTTETASNGLTKVVNDIQLGGTLLNSTNIALNSQEISFQGSGSNILYISDSAIDLTVNNNKIPIVSVSNSSCPFPPELLITNKIGTNNIESVLELRRNTTSTAANNIGLKIDFTIENSSGIIAGCNEIHSKFLDVTNGAEISEFSILGANAGSFPVLLQISGDGIFTLTQGLQNFIDDTTAAIGGIPINGLYRNGSIIQIRVS